MRKNAQAIMGGWIVKGIASGCYAKKPKETYVPSTNA